MCVVVGGGVTLRNNAKPVLLRGSTGAFRCVTPAWPGLSWSQSINQSASLMKHHTNKVPLHVWLSSAHFLHWLASACSLMKQCSPWTHDSPSQVFCTSESTLFPPWKWNKIHNIHYCFYSKIIFSRSYFSHSSSNSSSRLATFFFFQSDPDSSQLRFYFYQYDLFAEPAFVCERMCLVHDGVPSTFPPPLYFQHSEVLQVATTLFEEINGSVAFIGHYTWHIELRLKKGRRPVMKALLNDWHLQTAKSCPHMYILNLYSA